MILVSFSCFFFNFDLLCSQRLTALKRAYADIILNTAKEAAARIMSSEQKAVRYKHELQVSKEEALGMLLRLKKMMDSKVKFLAFLEVVFSVFEVLGLLDWLCSSMSVHFGLLGWLLNLVLLGKFILDVKRGVLKIWSSEDLNVFSFSFYLLSLWIDS